VFQPTPLDAVRAYTRETSPLCFTTDIEWSPEWAIRDLFTLADEHGVPLTPFLTHRSEYLASRFGATIEEVTIREEHVSFPLPRELRVLQAKA
jgi:hypothetical protein